MESTIKKHDSAASKLGKTFGTLGIGVLAAGAAITGAFGAALIMGIQGVKDGEDATAQLDAVLKSTGGSAGVTRKSLIDMSDKMQLTTKFTQEQTLAAESLLLTFTNIGAKTFPRATKAAADMATALGGDMAGQSIALGKALNNPIKGVTALTRVGVTFTAEQKKSIKAMQESGDMAGAQAIILKELEKEFGGSAVAAGQTFSGQLEILKNAIGEVTESLALKFMPYLQKFMDFVVAHMPEIEKIFSVAFDTIGKVLSVVADFIKDILIPYFKAIWEWISPYMPQIKDAVKTAFDMIKTSLKIVTDFIINNVLPTYTKMLNWFVANFPKIKDAVKQAYDYIKPSFDKLVQTIKDTVMPIIMGLWDTAKKAMPGIKSIFEIAMPLIVVAVKLVIDIITLIVKTVGEIYGFIKPKLDSVADLFSIVFGGIKKVIDGVQWVLDKFNGTKMSDKQSTITTDYVVTGRKGQSIPGNANGTNNWPGGLSWVGERGPELVNLPKGSQVFDNNKSMDMTSDNSKGDVYVTINAPIALSPSEVARQLKRTQQELAFNF